MSVFNAFRKIRDEEPFTLPEAFEQVKSDHARLDVVDSPEEAAEAEETADRLLALCEELLLRALPPDDALLIRCGADLDGLRKRFARFNPSRIMIVAAEGKALADRLERLMESDPDTPKIGVDLSLKGRALVQFERVILEYLKPFLLEAYKGAVFIKATAVCVRVAAPPERNRCLTKLRRQYSALLSSIQQREVLAELEEQMADLEQHLAADDAPGS